MRIVVHIDRLVLDGFPAGANTRQLRAAVERELSRLLVARPPDSWRGGAVERVTAPGGVFNAADRPEAIGRGVARAAGFGIATTQAGDVQLAFAGSGGEQL